MVLYLRVQMSLFFIIISLLGIIVIRDIFMSNRDLKKKLNVKGFKDKLWIVVSTTHKLKGNLYILIYCKLKSIYSSYIEISYR